MLVMYNVWILSVEDTFANTIIKATQPRKRKQRRLDSGFTPGSRSDFLAGGMKKWFRTVWLGCESEEEGLR